MKTARKHQMGEGGFCVCPKCNHRIEHQSGIPCQDHRCPECGTKMLREGSEHHKLFLEKKARS